MGPDASSILEIVELREDIMNLSLERFGLERLDTEINQAFLDIHQIFLAPILSDCVLRHALKERNNLHSWCGAKSYLWATARVLSVDL